jgi:hypothetical protein
MKTGRFRDRGRPVEYPGGTMAKSMGKAHGSSGAASVRRAAAFLVAAFLASAALAQETAPAAPAPAAAGAKLPRSFRGISLGMNLEALKAALAADDLFAFRGDRDVSLLPQSDQTLIETTGLSFVRRAFFQLKDDALFMMAFSLDTDKVDHYSVFTAFVADYGEPSALDPAQAVWLSDETRVSVERPLTVKYIDRAAFDKLAEDSKVVESRGAVLRKEFLDGF